MRKRTLLLTLCSLFLLGSFTASADAKTLTKTWTDPKAASQEDPDFLIQGEYGKTKAGAKYGVQVIALGHGTFDAYLLEGGLPGLGWERGKPRQLLKGKRNGEKIDFTNEEGTITGTISDGQFILVLPEKHPLPRIERKSPTLNAAAPKDAVVLFDGSSADQWNNGKVENGFLLATGCTSKQRFADYKLHLEFRTPYMPAARGQGRGNSGVYHSGRWETQILDSFGLEGKDNQAGGIYSISIPRLNMCLPPLAWQTYDVDFKAAKFDTSGKQAAWPRITVKLNGVLVHEDLELAKNLTTSAPLKGPLKDSKGPVHLQNHNNPVVFRNIWVVPGK
ncbi:3-keto-disaccharide hydrolase [Rubritalea profundi]|uniref:3-keto-alpha-glucoside-1,2-lyase/3-keto-2-hydroxy-glucal hydratase domain-containing protein n=1 Tax=Rubritalea profundi TaxID=1658618 RepID=A0A2S7U0U4_9BACT|nr:DUF1080 domain-containing protein [Rubritalea profundi]PQJ28190.1 hypothetical protein BSZ32_06510 [Rubritalea profundi]